jgi:hypothetical protein
MSPNALSHLPPWPIGISSNPTTKQLIASAIAKSLDVATLREAISEMEPLVGS